MKTSENILTLSLGDIYKAYARIYVFLPGQYDWSIMGDCQINVIGCNKKEDILECYELEEDMLDKIWNMKPNTFKVIRDNTCMSENFGNWNVFRVNIEQ